MMNCIFIKRSLQVEEENLRARREQLRYKEESMKDIEKRYEERLQNEIIKYFYFVLSYILQELLFLSSTVQPLNFTIIQHYYLL